MMKIFEELNAKNFKMFAAKHYNNPECTDVSEFDEDLARFKYLKILIETTIAKNMMCGYKYWPIIKSYLNDKGFWSQF